MLLNNQWITKQYQKGNQRIPRDKWKWKHNDSKPMGCSKSSSKKEVYSNKILPQETRKTSNKQPNFTPKTTGKRTKKNWKLVEGKKLNDLSRNKLKRNERNNSKN